MPRRAVRHAEPSRLPQPRPRRIGAVLLLIALSALAGQASQTALHGYPAARYVTLALIALSALCFGAAMWLAHRR